MEYTVKQILRAFFYYNHATALPSLVLWQIPYYAEDDEAYAQIYN